MLQVVKEKSDFAQCLHKTNRHMKLIHDAEFVNLYQSKTTRTCGDYYDDELFKVFPSLSNGLWRTNFTFDKCL